MIVRVRHGYLSSSDQKTAQSFGLDAVESIKFFHSDILITSSLRRARL